ncbi:MAG: 2-C-methyl-D-erythritol 4-phosphate cytidylyltransferase [Actinomycetes bacterium]
MTTAAVIPAAGRGERLGPGAPKALRELGGQPMLVHAVHAMANARSVDLVVVAAPADELDSVRVLLAPVGGDTPVLVVAGGETRQDSVGRALATLPDDVDVVLVHDAARPLAPPELADAVVATVRSGADAVVPGVVLADTVKQVDPAGRVEATPDRESLRAIQTPQGFRRDVLQRAHAEAAGQVATDDAGLVERIGRTVLVVPGSEEAFKVTRPLDLAVAEVVLARRRRAGGTA